MNRTDTLRNAEALINGDRARDYGDAAENFQRIADLCTPVLAAKLQPGARLDAHEVALILTQLKVARLITSPAHEDSWTDACGYLALGAEIATGGTLTPEPDTRPAEPPQNAAHDGLRVGARVKVRDTYPGAGNAGILTGDRGADNLGDWWTVKFDNGTKADYFDFALEVIA